MCRKGICLVSFLILVAPASNALAIDEWWNQDINTSGGSTSERVGRFIVKGDGADIWDNSDSFHYVYKVLQGDGAITARVISQQYTNEWAKAGVMIRESLNSNSKHCFMAVTPTIDHGVAFQNRAVAGSGSSSAHTNPLWIVPGATGRYPCWVRLVRQGNSLKGYVSADGLDWRVVPGGTGGDASPNPRTIPMNDQVYIGLAVTSHTAGVLCQVEFDNVSHTGNVAGKSVQPKASAPNPPDGAVGVLNPILKWKKGDTAVSHNVYLGTNPSLSTANLKASHLFTTSYYHTPGFQPGVTYYWRVDEIAADGTIHLGDVWHFTIAGKTAYDPSPADGAVAVDLNPTLAWQPGQDATRHQVFFGKSFDAVDTGTGQLAKAQTTSPLYVPGKLDRKTTYYWRVDESDGTRTYKGKVWSFTTKGLAGGLKGQYYNDQNFGSLALTCIDPQINFWWGQGSPSPSVNADNFSVRWTGEVEIPLSALYTFITRSDDGVRLYVDNRLVISNWTDHSATDDSCEPISLVGGQTYPIRMEFYEAGGDAVAVLEWQSPSMSRQVVPSDLLSPPYRASKPRPANLSTVPMDAKVILSWSSGEKAVQHDIYFGGAQHAVRLADVTDDTGIYRGRQIGNNYVLQDDLQRGKTYYWRVDEQNSDGTATTGNIWCFTVADCVIIDDFEAYFDRLDPWSAYSGASVAPESTIAHEGAQSMEFDYRNNSYPYSSTLERTWDEPQDWTQHGPKTLTLWFYAKPNANTAIEPLFIELRDSSWTNVLSDPSSVDVATLEAWQRWDINLQKFSLAGINLKEIVSLSVIVGDPITRQPGGSGRLFIDDIRLTDLTP